MILMRILIYGAGVIGSLYAALFAEAGYDTNIYARGKRLEVLRNNGLLYKKNQEVIKAEIRILRELPNDDIYDFVLLTVRENQLYEALTELKNNKSNTIVTMMNSLDSYNKCCIWNIFLFCLFNHGRSQIQSCIMSVWIFFC